MPYSTSMFVSSAAISRVKFNTRMWVHCPNGALTTRLDSTRRDSLRGCDGGIVKAQLVNA